MLCYAHMICQRPLLALIKRSKKIIIFLWWHIQNHITIKQNKTEKEAVSCTSDVDKHKAFKTRVNLLTSYTLLLRELSTL